mmetsp:Transcript_129609/g.276427  ORF Transcript_129609/g.276427 Transcript_129609/m.276427 type:complete len:434 (+) Transcript_129609:150-1451(+)
MSIIGGSLVGVLSTRLPPSGSLVGGSLVDGSLVGGSLVGNRGPGPYGLPAGYPYGGFGGGGSVAVPGPAGGTPGSVAVPPGTSAAAPTGSVLIPMVPQGDAAGAGTTVAYDGLGVDGAALVAQIPSLTADLATPDSIMSQKDTYAKDLESQLQQGVELLGATHKQKTDYLHASANQQKHQYNLMLDQQVKQQEMVLSQQYNQQLMMLQQAAQQQRAELEQQAAGLTLEWQQRQTQEEFLKEQRGIQQRYAQVQQELAVEMEKVGGTQGSSMCLPIGGPSMVSTPAGSVLVPIASASAVAPCAKYDAPPVVATGRCVAAPLTTGRLPYVPPGCVPASGSYAPPAVMSTQGGSCLLPPGSCSVPPGQLSGSPSYAPSTSRSPSYVPPVGSGSVRVAPPYMVGVPSGASYVAPVTTSPYTPVPVVPTRISYVPPVN